MLVSLLIKYLVDLLFIVLHQEEADDVNHCIDRCENGQDAQQSGQEAAAVAANGNAACSDGHAAKTVGDDGHGERQIALQVEEYAGEQAVEGGCDHPDKELPDDFAIAAHQGHAQKGDGEAEAHTDDGVEQIILFHNNILLNSVFKFFEILTGNGENVFSGFQLDQIVAAEFRLNALDMGNVDQSAFVDLGKCVSRELLFQLIKFLLGFVGLVLGEDGDMAAAGLQKNDIGNVHDVLLIFLIQHQLAAVSAPEQLQQRDDLVAGGIATDDDFRFRQMGGFQCDLQAINPFQCGVLKNWRYYTMEKWVCHSFFGVRYFFGIKRWKIRGEMQKPCPQCGQGGGLIITVDYIPKFSHKSTNPMK